MRVMILCLLMLSFLNVSAQKKDSVLQAPAKKPEPPINTAIQAPVLPDSVMTYPDTLIIKVPAALAPTFIAQLNGSDDQVIVAYLKELLRVVGPQIKRQYIKKPKK